MKYFKWIINIFCGCIAILYFEFLKYWITVFFCENNFRRSDISKTEISVRK